MTALGEWLKQLILIVLFAVFAEMLLPTKALERYIRMVLGLALIATMLQPLGILLEKNWASQLASQAVSELTKAQPDNTVLSGSLGSVQGLQNRLNQDRESQADTLLANQLEASITNKFGIEPRSVSVTGAGTKGDFHVHVVIGQTQMSRASPIRQWVSSELGLSTNNITVDANGGG